MKAITFSPFEDHKGIKKLLNPFTLTACHMKYDYMWQANLQDYLKRWIKSIEEVYGKCLYIDIVKDEIGEWKVLFLTDDEQSSQPETIYKDQSVEIAAYENGDVVCTILDEKLNHLEKETIKAKIERFLFGKSENIDTIHEAINYIENHIE